MRTSDIVKSKFFRGKDLQGKPPLVLTIADVTEEVVGRGGGRETKCYLWFNETLKGLGLNATRTATLEAAYGPESDLWTGARVRLSFDPTVMFGDKIIGGIKLVTPSGIVYDPAAAGASGAWGAPAAGPPGAPPPPVWDGTKWVVSQPPPAAPRPPPPPVWNQVTGVWDTVNPATGEIGPPSVAAHAAPPPPPPANPQDSTWGGAPTLGERMAAPPADDWGRPAAPGAPPTDFDDDIPF